MSFDFLSALSPLDGRYQPKLSALQGIFSEYGLIYQRVQVEIAWLKWLLATLPELTNFTKAAVKLDTIVQNFDPAAAKVIKSYEKNTEHDVKAVEYYLRDQLTTLGLTPLIPFIHFAATSEDINNVAYALMLKTAREQVLTPLMQEVATHLQSLAHRYAALAMLAYTHGQPATPTTLGKELNNFSFRLQRQLEQFKNVPILAKFNGAVGNFNAHLAAYPTIDWAQQTKAFVESFQLVNNPYTTQIEPHDGIAEYLHVLVRFNTIILDLDRDLWTYISMGYFTQKKTEQAVGSSTMPHKVNPIDFENSEGNCGIANALANHLATKLPVSRLQRDLSDSTVLRNLGSIFGYCLISYSATLQGLTKLAANEAKIAADLQQHWEILAEAIQTVMRKHGIADAYEQLKKFTHGKQIDQATLHAFIQQLKLPTEAKNMLLKLTPHDYLGLAEKLARG